MTKSDREWEGVPAPRATIRAPVVPNHKPKVAVHSDEPVIAQGGVAAPPDPWARDSRDAGKPKSGQSLRAARTPVDKLDSVAIRARFGMSRPEFCRTFGNLDIETVRAWDRGKLSGPVRALLTLIDRMPNEVREALKP